MIVELSKEPLELGGLLIVDLKCDLLRHFRKLLNFAKNSFKIGLYLLVWILELLDHGKFVAGTVAVL